MIADDMKNWMIYKEINPAFIKAFNFLEDIKINSLPYGIHFIDGNKIYATISSYNTLPVFERKWESHKKYIDIQYIIEGIEYIGYCPIKETQNPEEYSNEKDVIIYNDSAESSLIELKEKQFAIFFPEDAHKPGCYKDKSDKVRKIVIKVLI